MTHFRVHNFSRSDLANPAVPDVKEPNLLSDVSQLPQLSKYLEAAEIEMGKLLTCLLPGFMPYGFSFGVVPGIEFATCLADAPKAFMMGGSLGDPPGP